jgi:hypothetical protein
MAGWDEYVKPFKEESMYVLAWALEVCRVSKPG